ncbi:MAG: amidohydrolase [Gammaproteobacteria bacterium]|nr:amidohydrolase [Gammaproteobacteria bacterium]
MLHLIRLVCALFITSVLVTATADESPLRDAIGADYDYLAGLFEHFHRHPELSYREEKTARRLAQELRDAGVEVTEGVGGTGLVGIMKNGAGPVVMLRADMDGLPIEEKSGLSYGSTARQTDVDGREFPVMHACGHDVHMTVLVGTARRLQAMRDDWRGTIVLVGQPAEERIGGAARMLEDGLYQRFPRPDYALAMHVSSALETGKFRLDPGIAFSSSDSIDLIVHGVGSHGASPHLGKDPVVIASQIVLALQTLVAREISPMEPAVVTVGAFHAGTKHNIISDRAELQLTVRSDRLETRTRLLEGIKRIAENIGRAAGLPEDRLPEVRPPVASTLPTINDPEMTGRIRAALISHFGEDAFVVEPRSGMGAEDFSYFLQVEPPVPGVYFRVGGTPKAAFEAADAGGPPVPPHHSPLFRIAPRPSIVTGVEAMTISVLELLGRPPRASPRIER